MVLVGHGAPAKDCPPELTARFKALEGQRRRRGEPASAEEQALDRKIRDWPRDDDSDPYRAGLERLASALAPLLPDQKLVLAYNEFCAPSVEEAVTALAADGFTQIAVVPSMLTPGGVHSEEEIPETLQQLRQRLPSLTIRYAWPFDLSAVAAMLGEHVRVRGAPE